MPTFDRAAMGASVLGMVIAAICGPYAFFALVPDGEPGVVDLSTWIEAGKFRHERTVGLTAPDLLGL